MTEGFLEFQTQFVLDQFPTYPPWAEAISMFMLNSVCPNAMLPGGGAGIPLALNFLGIGPSRLGFKSTPLNHIVKPVLRRAEVHLLPPKFTAEGMYAYLHTEENKKIESTVLIRDEASGLIGETKKQYLADELTFLTELIDGELTGRRTVTHGFQKRREIKVLFICCGTPHIFTLIDQGFWTQGLGNRMIPIYWVKPATTSLPFVMHELDFSGRIQQSANMLKEYQKVNVQRVMPDEEVQQLFQIEEFSRRVSGWDGYLEDKIDITAPMYYECNVFIKKIAAIRAIDRQKGIQEPIIIREDFEWAKKWVQPRYEEIEEMYKDWAGLQLRRKQGTLYVSPGSKILRCLQKHPSGLTKTRLNNLTRVSAKERERVLNELIANKMLEEKTEYRDGKPVSIYKLKET